MRNRTATRFVIAALAVTLVAAGAIATASSRAVGGQRTIALVTLAQSPDSHELARGAREAAAALGGRFVLEAVGDAAVRRTIAGLVAARVAAIAVEPPFTSASLASLLEQARKAGIATLSVEQPVAGSGSVWVDQAFGPAQFADALVDALASQIHGRGDYAIVGEVDQDPIASQWQSLVKRYAARAYPGMKLDAVFMGASGGGPLAWTESVLRAHPSLRGLIALTPTEAVRVAQAIEVNGDVGKVFSAGNCGSPIDSECPALVRSGAAELVVPQPSSDATRLGYLMYWAAGQLADRRSFKPGLDRVGGAIGSVWYQAAGRELRLGPVTITRANVARYGR